jgi:cytochrome c oxidase subunit 2
VRALDTLNPASPLAAAITKLFVAVLLVLGFIFALVAVLVVVAIVRYGRRPADELPNQIFGSDRLEIVWTAVPIFLLAVIFVFTVRVMHAANPSPASRAPDLLVVGHQWWWEVNYLKSGVVTANELHLPVGQRVLIRLESADVIHDFWVPRLGRKLDAVPGHPGYLWLEADRPGVYLGACAEFCGAEHAWMRFEVVAQPQAEFAAWQQAQLAVAPTPKSGKALAGMKLFAARTCVNCHRLAGTAADQRVGPDLTHLASRRMLAGGAVVNTPATLAQWLKNPDSIKPGSHMPNFQLSDAEVAELVAYLEGAK